MAPGGCWCQPRRLWQQDTTASGMYICLNMYNAHCKTWTRSCTKINVLIQHCRTWNQDYFKPHGGKVFLRYSKEAKSPENDSTLWLVELTYDAVCLAKGCIMVMNSEWTDYSCCDFVAWNTPYRWCTQNTIKPGIDKMYSCSMVKPGIDARTETDSNLESSPGFWRVNWYLALVRLFFTQV